MIKQNTTFVENTSPLFFADMDHDEKDSIIALMTFLEDLKLKGTHDTLFVEFLTSNPPQEEGAIREEFITLSKRRSMAETYAKMVLGARELGFNVVGLSLLPYANMPNPSVDLYFRRLGGFDRVAIEIIRQKAQPGRSIVFLGIGHYRVMKDMGAGFPGMALFNATETDIMDPEETKEQVQAQITRFRKIEDVRTESDGFLSNALSYVIGQSISPASTGKFTIQFDGRVEEFDLPNDVQDNKSVQLKTQWEGKFQTQLPSVRERKIIQILRNNRWLM